MAAKKDMTEAPAETVEETAPAAEETKEDNLVEVFVPRGSANEDPNLFVSVNGVNYLLPKGKKSKVPAEIAHELERAQKAQELMDEHIDEMLESSK